jgi:uncharacterized RDD family membrane protein YckC
MFCSKCGSQVADAAAFCPSCGQPTSGQPAAPRGIPLAPTGFTPQPAASAPSTAIPPAMPAAYPPAAVARPIGYAGFWLRFVAAIIDIIILWIPLAFGIFWAVAGSGLLNLIRSGQIQSPDAVMSFVGVSVILRIALALLIGSLVIPWLYFACMECSSWQGTVGKKTLGLYVTDLQGNRISFGKATGRFFSKIIFQIFPYAGPLLLYPIDCICAGLTEKKQALHDMIASCLVLRKI